jgi:hypothetical protein
MPTLKDKEIWSLYKLLPKKKLNISNKNTKDLNLVWILVVTKAVLRDVYQLYNNTSPDQKIT